MMHITENQDALLDYLYDEGDPAERLKIAQHLQECAACSVAVVEFQSVRGLLAEWTPPAAELGFRLVKEHGAVPEPASDRRWSSTWPMRAWAQAAAAVVLFVAGMVVSQLTFDYQHRALTVRMRGAQPDVQARTASVTLPPAGPVSVVAPSAASGTSATPQNLAALERELREHLTAASTSEPETERLLQRVRAMIDQSEQRQQRELALRLSQIAREVDTQHQADLLRIQQNFGQQQEQMMDYLVKTSGGTR